MRYARLFALGIASVFASNAWADPAKVEIAKTDTGYQLHVDGQPFFIQGAGGDESRQTLKDIGGNAFRTWGADDLDRQLAEADKLGLKVVAGIWLKPERHGFDYNDPKQVEAQFQMAKRVIDQYKDSHAVLAWGIGNEMDGYEAGDNPKIWAAVEAIAAYAKSVDPNHPTMTVVAEVGGKRIACIHEQCPHIDIVGINSYGGCASLPDRYRKAGGTRPYIVTEFGPPGTWEIPKNDWGAVQEPTSTAKAAAYKNNYEHGILAEKDKLCLGSFVFAWGHKQEATATWFGMFLSDGSRTQSVDVMQEEWSGKEPTNHAPTIDKIAVDASKLGTGATIHATLASADPDNDPLTAEWMLSEEVPNYNTGGDVEATPPVVADAITKSDASGAEVKMPAKPGKYRLFVTLRDGKGSAATANVPLFIDGKIEPGQVRLAPAPKLPLVLFGDGQKGLPYVWSGWMGKQEALAMDEKSKDNPHSGDLCMKCEFKSADNFGGIVWQSPANDWGDADGGFDLSAAKKLTFWARGAEGGEKVEFKFGVLGKNTKFPDTGNGSMTVTLGTEWKQYEIPLDHLDLRRIKTGFAWDVGNPGKPVAFYLDDIQYE